MQLTSNFVILASALATSVLALPVANPSFELDARDVDIDLVTREVTDFLDARAVSAPSTPTNSKFSSDLKSPSDAGGSRSRQRPAALNEESLNSYRDGPRSGGLSGSRLDRYGGQSPQSGRLGSSRGELSPLRTGDSERSGSRTPGSALSPTTPKSASKLDSKNSVDSHKKSDVSKSKKAHHHKKSIKQRLREAKAKRSKRKADRKAKADKKKAERKAKHDKKKADRKAKHDKKKADREEKKAEKKAAKKSKVEKKKSDNELSKKAKSAEKTDSTKLSLNTDRHDGLRSASLDSPRLRSARPLDREGESSRFADSPRTGGFRDGGRRTSESSERNVDSPRGGRSRTSMYKRSD